jgi:hypothetical protein
VLKVLDCFLVLSRGFDRVEGAEVAAAFGFRIYFP